jgi:hypothetical protein
MMRITNGALLLKQHGRIDTANLIDNVLALNAKFRCTASGLRNSEKDLQSAPQVTAAMK